MKSVSDEARVYIYTGVADMRAGFDRLAEFVKIKLGRTSTQVGSVYAFMNRGRDRVKLFYWDLDGYAIWYKRLEAGAFRVEQKDGGEEITGVDLKALLAGVDLARIKIRKSAENGLYK